MKKRRSFIAVMAMVMAMGCLPVIHAEAAQSVSMNIEKVEVSAADFDKIEAQDRQVAVDVRIEGNETGFLAAEFGIVYDGRLTLETVITDDGVGSCFSYMSNPETPFIWFSGANGTADVSASAGRQELLTLVFTLPEDYEVSDVYYIGYSWDALDGSSAYWYVDKNDNQIDWLRGHSISGFISIPDPSAPKLSVSELQMNQGDTMTLTVSNCDVPCIWYSDHSDIATVDNNGVVTAHSPGTCTINCYVGSSLLSCEVIVTDGYFYSIVGDAPIVLTNPENEVMLSYPNPEGMVIWVSTEPDVVQVSDGRVTGLKNGTAQIIASSNGLAYVRQIVVDFPEQSDTTIQTDVGTTSSNGVLPSDVPSITAPSDSDTTEVQTTTEETEAPEFQCGDVDHNGTIDIMDVILINRHLMIGAVIDQTAADVAQDGSVDAVDALTLLKYVVKLVEAIPVV